MSSRQKKTALGRRYLVGVDTGGTFTDVYISDSDGNVIVEKVPSTPNDVASAVFAGLKQAELTLQPKGPLIQSLDRLVHGTTVAVNAFLERKGARLAFIATKGFRDTLVMRRMYRENMYDTRSPAAKPLVTPDLIFEVDERVDHEGRIVTKLNENDVLNAIKKMKENDITAVGVCFLYSFRNPLHEQRTKELISEHLPGVYISISYDVCPEIRDYERASTTHLNAYLQPPVSKYLRTIDKTLRDSKSTTTLQVMQSYGGVIGAIEASEKPVNLMLSGPAGGVMGSAYWGAQTGYPNIIAFDMGGTSCDISLISDAAPTLSSPTNTSSTKCKFESFDVLTPFIDIHTIGSGGGSRAWFDDDGGLHVGPESMGADPGPACYGKGGIEATVTDADVVLGYIDPEYFLGGRIKLDPEIARSAVKRIADKIGCSIPKAADGIFRIINANMINGVRVVSIEKGHDPRRFALLSFGGAGGVHSSYIIEELGIDKAIIPETAAAFSAFGLLCTDLRHDYVKTVYKLVSDLNIKEIQDAVKVMEKRGAEAFKEQSNKSSQIRYEYTADLRYAGQGHDIRVSLPLAIDRLTNDQIVRSFNETYQRVYGYLANHAEIMLINLRVIACIPSPKPLSIEKVNKSSAPLKSARKKSRQAFFSETDSYVETAVYDGTELAPGNRIKGPAIVEAPTTTVVVRPGQSLQIDSYRNAVICRRKG